MRSCSSVRDLVAGLLLCPALLFSELPRCIAAEGSAGTNQGAARPQSVSTETKSSVVENSVVKVFSTVRYPDFFKPWTKQAPSEVTGTGVVIEGKRILSNAHVVLY